MEAVSPELEHKMPPAAVVTQMAMGFIVSQSLAVAARLRIADHLAGGAKTTAELAALTATHEPSLYRLLRALASVGVLRKEGEKFTNTELGDVLRSDHPQSMRAALHMMGDPEHWNSHGNMQHSVETGGIAFNHTFGMPVFPYFAANPQAAEVFDDSMTAFSRTVAEAVSSAYDFSRAATIADIAGGQGILLAKVLQKNPRARGVLFEQPQVLEGNILAREGVADRTETVSGNFFEEVPVTADVYLMKFIIHDWNDEQSRRILSNLAKSAPQGAKVLLVETVVEEDDNAASLSKVMDLNMLVMTGGKERTEREYAALFEQTGFKLEKVYPTAPLQIVEAVKV